MDLFVLSQITLRARDIKTASDERYSEKFEIGKPVLISMNKSIRCEISRSGVVARSKCPPTVFVGGHVATLKETRIPIARLICAPLRGFSNNREIVPRLSVRSHSRLGEGVVPFSRPYPHTRQSAMGYGDIRRGKVIHGESLEKVSPDYFLMRATGWAYA
jgi:hypothetical protein